MTTNIDREALIASVLSSWGRRKNYFDVDGMAESAVDTILACAGFRRQGPITPAKAWEEGRIAGGKHALDIQARLNAGEPSPPSLTNPYEAEQ